MTAIARRFQDEITSGAHFAVLGGITVVETVLVALVFFSPPAESVASSQVTLGCRSFVEVRSPAPHEDDQISLWSSLAIDRWKTGDLARGRQALIVDQNVDGYKVLTSDGIKGWVSNFQVSRTLRQDAETQQPCS